MQKSAHNIFSQVKNSDRYFLINPLSREADLLDSETAREYRDNLFSDPSVWEKKGYLVDPEEEKKRFLRGYLEWTERQEKEALPALLWIQLQISTEKKYSDTVVFEASETACC